MQSFPLDTGGQFKRTFGRCWTGRDALPDQGPPDDPPQQVTSIVGNLDGSHFDVLAGVLFNEDYSVLRAALVPRSVVVDRAKFVEHTNSHKFLLRDDVWKLKGVNDVTENLNAVEL